jgi:hypothetical protein
MAGLSFLSDADFIGPVLDAPSSSLFGHRGAAHSLACAGAESADCASGDGAQGLDPEGANEVQDRCSGHIDGAAADPGWRI